MKITEDKNDLDFAGRFEFTALGDITYFKNISQKDNMELLKKWGLYPNSELLKLRFNLAFDLKELDNFVLDLFNDSSFRSLFPQMSLISLSNNEKFIKNFTFKKLSCSASNLDILDPMYKDNKIVGKESGINK